MMQSASDNQAHFMLGEQFPSWTPSSDPSSVPSRLVGSCWSPDQTCPLTVCLHDSFQELPKAAVSHSAREPSTAFAEHPQCSFRACVRRMVQRDDLKGCERGGSRGTNELKTRLVRLCCVERPQTPVGTRINQIKESESFRPHHSGGVTKDCESQ